MCIFPTDFLRTHSQPTSKSPQKFIPTSLLPENQGLIQKSLHVGFVVIVVFKPSKPTITTFPTLSFSFHMLYGFVVNSKIGVHKLLWIMRF